MSFPATNTHHYRQSSRTLYPTFLSVGESLQLQAQFALQGLQDSLLRWGLVWSKISTDTELRANVLKSVLVNFISLLSILIYLPIARDHGYKWLHRVGWAYQILWLLPLLGTSLYLNRSWSTVIAKRAFLLQYGSRAWVSQPSSYNGMLTAIATSAYRVVMIATSFGVSLALSSIPGPYVGAVLSFVFLCWVNSYYCFEFVWIARDMSLSRRIRFLEERWAYFLAFGLPIAALSNWSSALANAATFALIYPFFIIAATHGRPTPLDPYNPASTDSDNVRHPSPYVPIRVPVFAPVLWLNDVVVNVVTVGGVTRAGKRRSRGGPVQSESMEAGEVLPSSPRGEQRFRVNRRKLD